MRTNVPRVLLGALPALLAGMLLVSGCTGIPETSSPQSVKSLVIQPQDQQVASPEPGADPRSIVNAFLNANASGDPHHTGARAFLTPEARNRWSDSTITVVDNPQVGNVDAKNRVTVKGQEIGTVDASGVYTPSLRGNGTGSGGVPVTPSFAVTRVRGQWRIDSLQNGLLVSYAQFQQYQQRVLYFYDLPEQHLVPDPRFSQLTDPSALAEWLITQEVEGPRDVLQNAVTTELPAQTDPKRVTVDVNGSPARVAIPGAAQLDSTTKNRLAAQIGLTLAQVAQVDGIEITDGGRAVAIPKVNGTTFSAIDFADQEASPPAESGLYYVRDGAAYDEFGAALPGRIGKGVYGLSSVALADRASSSGLLVAGVRGHRADGQLDIGSVAAGLIATSVHGRLSRPAWVPGEREVWIGAGPVLYRVAPAGKGASAAVVEVTAASGKASGRVTAVRLSPDGSRVAIVLTNPDGGAQLWIGAVVRGPSGKARVDGLAPISPQGITVTDVAWNNELKLFAIGRDSSTSDPGIYEVQVDGSLWTARGIGNLPQAPDSITVTENVVASVSAGGTVWKQRAGLWVSPHGDETRGTNPVYVE